MYLCRIVSRESLWKRQVVLVRNKFYALFINILNKTPYCTLHDTIYLPKYISILPLIIVPNY